MLLYCGRSYSLEHVSSDSPLVTHGQIGTGSDAPNKLSTGSKLVWPGLAWRLEVVAELNGGRWDEIGSKIIVCPGTVPCLEEPSLPCSTDTATWSIPKPSPIINKARVVSFLLLSYRSVLFLFLLGFVSACLLFIMRDIRRD